MIVSWQSQRIWQRAMRNGMEPVHRVTGQMPVLRAVLLLLTLSVGHACGDEDVTPAIVGDWFSCTTTNCGTLGLKGSRFKADGTLVHLYPEKQVLDASSGYCRTTNPDLDWTYTHDGKNLETFEKSGVSERHLFVIDNDVARVFSEGKTGYMKRVDPPRDRGSCSERTPWICPSAKMDGTTDKCQLRWICDNGTYQVLCEKKGDAFQCRCLEAGVQKGSFSSNGLCSLMDLSALIKEANTGCGWKLSLPL